MQRITEAFHLIDQEVQNIMKELLIVADGMTSSKHLGENVLAKVENISAIVEETAAGSEEISSSTAEQLVAIERVVKKVSDLRQRTNELYVKISRFKL
ncbi:hypothetical protein [Bacillus massiliigorillae]|uniref:hypothetical protein n=1 Tax=Bacillus massiliigorillae TaxID=1243664 RepID=UPI0003A26671|nr:hypothetical protein [Bacillus massiliigorillae]